MFGRKADNITRVDIRIPNELYDEISAIAPVPAYADRRRTIQCQDSPSQP